MVMKSGKFPFKIFRHEGQTPQPSKPEGEGQFNVMLKALAVLVFPMPEMPVKR
jgi:hypothetical protein